MLHIRPFNYSDHDYAQTIAIQNANWPDQPESVTWWQYRDQVRSKEHFYQTVLAELEGQIVAHAFYMEPSWSYRPGKYHIGIMVHPDYQRRGIGAAVYEHILAALAQRELKPTLLTSYTREDKVEAIRFLEKRGFTQTMRSPLSRLDLTMFDKARFAGIVEKVLTSGIQIYSIAQLQQMDPEYQQKIYELDWQGTLDEPLPDAPTKPPFADYVKFFFENPTYLPEGCFIALDQGEYVGMSMLSRNLAITTELNTGFTCVLRSHRRRNIATALKLCAIDYAQCQGMRAIKTGNEENNPMFAINRTLGFEPQPASLDFQKQME